VLPINFLRAQFGTLVLVNKRAEVVFVLNQQTVEVLAHVHVWSLFYVIADFPVEVVQFLPEDALARLSCHSVYRRHTHGAFDHALLSILHREHFEVVPMSRPFLVCISNLKLFIFEGVNLLGTITVDDFLLLV